MSRRPKAKAAFTEKDAAWAFERYIGREDDPSLEWSESPARIRKQLRTVQGVAKLAKVNRKTVTRHGIAPDSAEAMVFVVQRRLRMRRPLVSQKGKTALDGETERFLWVVQKVKDTKLSWAAHRSGFVDPKLTKKPRETGYGKNVHHIPGLRVLAEPERNHYNWKRRFHYRPQTRVTVAALCSALDWSRQRFYKWALALPKVRRDALRREMVITPLELRAEPAKVRQASDYVEEYLREYERIYARCDGESTPPS